MRCPDSGERHPEKALGLLIDLDGPSKESQDLFILFDVIDT